MNLIVIFQAKQYFLDLNVPLPKAEVIIVPGCFVFNNGTPTEMLRDRLDTAIEVLNKNKSLKIIVTGDHGTKEYDEVNAMRKYLENKGVDPSIIFMDHAGFNTYDSMYRAKAIFEVKAAIIVTQKYHLSRAVYNARQMGIIAYGVAADKHSYPAILRYQAREALARCKDFVLVNILKPNPKYLGDKIPVMSSDVSATQG